MVLGTALSPWWTAAPSADVGPTTGSGALVSHCSLQTEKLGFAQYLALCLLVCSSHLTTSQGKVYYYDCSCFAEN